MPRTPSARPCRNPAIGIEIIRTILAIILFKITENNHIIQNTSNNTNNNNTYKTTHKPKEEHFQKNPISTGQAPPSNRFADRENPHISPQKSHVKNLSLSRIP